MISGLNRNKIYDSLIRLQKFPIDSTEIFETTNDFETYLRNDETAYVGQLVRIKDNLQIPIIYLIFKDRMESNEHISDCAIRLLNYNDFVALQSALNLERTERTQDVQRLTADIVNYVNGLNARINHIESDITDEQKAIIKNIVLSSYYTKAEIERAFATKQYVNDQIISLLQGSSSTSGNIIFESQLEEALTDYYTKDSIDALLAEIKETDTELGIRLDSVETEIAKIDGIETSVSSLQTSVEAIQNILGTSDDPNAGTSILSRLDTMSTDIADISSDITNLQTSDTQQNAAISSIQTDLGNIKNSMLWKISKAFNSSAICKFENIPSNAEIESIDIQISAVPSDFQARENKDNDVFYAERIFAGGNAIFYKRIISNQLENDILIDEENPYLIDTEDLCNSKVNDVYSYNNLHLYLNAPILNYCLDMREYVGIQGTITIKYYEIS